VDFSTTSTDDLPVPPVTSRRSLYFDTGDDLYIGGVPAHAYNTLPGDVGSRDGFRGCVTSLRLDGSEPVNLLEHPFGIPEQYRRHISPGCLDDESRSPCAPVRGVLRSALQDIVKLSFSATKCCAKCFKKNFNTFLSK